ncbi:MAG: hypothetical protein Q4A93_04485 [Actinomycetota bacterium]|nr:hypothetical protein [Actinomycetota bacterium]
MSIPIVIGATGHRDLRDEDVPQLRDAVRGELAKLQATYSHSPFTMLNSLAAGADMLCAQEALALGMRLVCPLPFEADEYRRDFDGADLEEFESLLRQADEVFVAPAQEPTAPGRDFGYRQAGIYVATHCHALLALWDGMPGGKGGCGTGEAVGFMLEDDYIGAPPFDAEGDGAVIHVSCPRQSRNQEIPIAVELLEELPGSLHETLARTDVFNADCASTAKTSTDAGLQGTYDAADRLSTRFQTRYLRALWTLSLFCVLLVMAFLLYDEPGMNFMLIAWGVIIIAYAAFYRLVMRGKYHQKYIQYRVLAEATRVQTNLSSLGITVNVGNDFTWTQRHDITWVRKALDALLIGAPAPATATPDEVKAAWIDDQRAYHEGAAKRDGGKLAHSNRITRAMVICTVAIFLAIAILEYGFPDLMSSSVLGLELRSWGKIVWGCLTAVVMFVSGYYGRLSFERKAFDHGKMALLFAAAARRYETAPENHEAVFRDLAREEIIENGNWMSYCKEDRPTFSL